MFPSAADIPAAFPKSVALNCVWLTVTAAAHGLVGECIACELVACQMCSIEQMWLIHAHHHTDWACNGGRYAGLLEATMEHVPHVSPINVQELLDFCEDSGYKCRLEPRGTLLLPPDYNVGMTDWERSLRLRWAPFPCKQLRGAFATVRILCSQRPM